MCSRCPACSLPRSASSLLPVHAAAVTMSSNMPLLADRNASVPDVLCLCTGIEADGRSWSFARLAQADGGQRDEVGILISTEPHSAELQCLATPYRCKCLELLIALKLLVNWRRPKHMSGGCAGAMKECLGWHHLSGRCVMERGSLEWSICMSDCLPSLKP